ncbi:MAG: hypothetical protein HOW73_38245 [Polyangiaceae bacterium]|nr:hypothetical protein [Polyangiaceae bacterium]
MSIQRPDPARSTPPIEFETRYFPLVVVVLHGLPTDSEYQWMFIEWERIYARREKFLALTDARNVTDRAPPKQRAMLADWTRKTEPLLLPYSCGSAIIVESAWVRGALTAIHWLHKPKVPQAYFTKVPEAYDWAASRLTECGVAIPPTMRAYRDRL